MNLSKLWERLKDRRAWHAAVYSVVKSQTNSATEQQHRLGSLSKLGKSRAGGVDKAYFKSSKRSMSLEVRKWTLGVVSGRQSCRSFAKAAKLEFHWQQ